MKYRALTKRLWLFMFFFSALILLGCERESQISTLSIDAQTLSVVQNAQYFEDLFIPDTIDLKVPQEYALGQISNIHLAESGGFLVSDENISHLVLRFDHQGSFVQQIGRYGRGPGEYLTPKLLATSNMGEIIITDQSNQRVTIYNAEGQYKKSFPINKLMACDMVVTNHDEIVIHSLQTAWDGIATTYVYDFEGNLKNKFGRTSDPYQRLVKIFPFQTYGPHLVYEDGDFFEADYADYRVRKYSGHGVDQSVFGERPTEWRSIIETDFMMLPKVQTANAQYMRALDRFMKEEFPRCSYVYSLYRLTPGVLGILLFNGEKSGFKNRLRFDLYDFDGNLLRQRLTFRKSVWTKGSHPAVLLGDSRNNLFMIKDMDSSSSEIQIIRIIHFNPRPELQTTNRDAESS